MNSSSAQGVLELTARDLGPIAEARIDLRPLTVFIGPSNTGKSYLAILIYALHRYFSGGGGLGHRLFGSYAQMLGLERNREVSMDDMDSIVAAANQLLLSETDSLSQEDIVLPGVLTDVIRSGLAKQGSLLGNEISRCFGIAEIGALIRKGATRNSSVVFRRHDTNDAASVDGQLSIGAQTSEFATTIPEGFRLRLGDDDDIFDPWALWALEAARGDGEKKLSKNLAKWRLMRSLVDYSCPQIFGSLTLPAFYLPADRTGVMHAHRAVVSALIGSAAMTGLRPAANMATLSGVLADFLEQLIELDSVSYRRRRSIRGLGAQIEDAIIGGVIGVDKSEVTGYPHFTYRPKGWKHSLSLMNASSMVSELAPVVLYLRYIVQPGHVLIIEEPESHLHPAMQVEFTRQLAMLVENGIRVIITTHSEWVLEELSNIVRRSELPARQAVAGDMGDKVALRSGQVGAWLFRQKKRPKGSIVEEIRLDAETGLYPTGYDDVSEELYNDSVNIFNRLQNRRP